MGLINLPLPYRRTFSIDETDWHNLEASRKKLGFDSRNKLIQSLVKSHLTGTTENQELTIKQQIEQEQLVKLQNQNDSEINDIKKRKLEAETKIVEYHANNVDVVGSKPSFKASSAMRAHITNPINQEIQRKYTYKYLESDSQPHKALCRVCEVLFESTEKHQCIDDVVWHIEEIHNLKAETLVKKN